MLILSLTISSFQSEFEVLAFSTYFILIQGQNG